MKQIRQFLLAGIFCSILAAPAFASGFALFFGSEAAFGSFAGPTSIIDFEGRACGTCTQDFGYGNGSPSLTLGGVTFTALPGVVNIGSGLGLSVVGPQAPYGAGHFYSAFLGEGNGNAIRAALPGGTTAAGANVGNVYSNTDQNYPDGLAVTVTLGSGAVQSQLLLPLMGLASGGSGPLGFVGVVAVGDTIQSIQFTPRTYLGIDNFQYSAQSGVPEPATWLLGACGCGLIAVRRLRGSAVI